LLGLDQAPKDRRARKRENEGREGACLGVGPRPTEGEGHIVQHARKHQRDLKTLKKDLGKQLGREKGEVKGMIEEGKISPQEKKE